MGTLAPVGTPVGLADVAASVLGSRSWSRTRPLEAALREITGRRYALAVGSGRMAIALLLEVLHERSARDRVLIPGYTCYTVPAAIARTGRIVVPVDVDPATLDFDYERLPDRDWSRVLAVVPSSLLGFPADLPRLETLCTEKGTALIDDSAQCLGANVGGRPCGSFGVAGVFSFGRGKNAAAMGGGAIVTDDEALYERCRELLAPAHEASDVEATVKSLAYSAVLRPNFYGAAVRLPFVEVGASRFDPRFPFKTPSGVQRALAARKIRNLESLTAERVTAARHYDELLGGHPGIQPIRAHEGAEPVYLRYTIRIAPKGRGRVYRLLEKAGLGASAMYPEAVVNIPGISAHLADDAGETPNADRLSRSILTLPTHPFVKARHREKIAEILKKNLREDRE